MSRCLLITVPAERADDVVGVLQDELHVQNVVRNTQDGSSTIRCFTSTSNAGFIIHHLDKIGVGVAYGEVALLAVPVLLPKRRNARLRELVKQANKNMGTSHRLAVEEIYGPVASGASLNFEYIAFIICAAIIAGVGLGTNNAVMIVASMLVSPLMGPILAFTLATNLKDWRLFKQGVMVLCVGIILTFGVGYILGLLAATNNEAPLYWNWPTTEMSSRGKVDAVVCSAECQPGDWLDLRHPLWRGGGAGMRQPQRGRRGGGGHRSVAAPPHHQQRAVLRLCYYRPPAPPHRLR